MRLKWGLSTWFYLWGKICQNVGNFFSNVKYYDSTSFKRFKRMHERSCWWLSFAIKYYNKSTELAKIVNYHQQMKIQLLNEELDKLKKEN